jgi:hypothetical protein
MECSDSNHSQSTERSGAPPADPLFAQKGSIPDSVAHRQTLLPARNRGSLSIKEGEHCLIAACD